jgi:hypothetical protein
MYKGQKSVRNGIQDFLCPFTDMCITQGSNMGSHLGTMANDVRGIEKGVRYPYYAPCDCKCIRVYPDYGQSMWQSLNKVRFANGRIDYATFMICHSNSQDCYVGQIVEQGMQLDNMGDKPTNVCTGVHCHIEISQSADTSWYKNGYGIYQFNNEYDTDDCYFVDNTNIIDGYGGNWRTTDQVPAGEVVDQILHKGSHVILTGIYEVKDINIEENTALITIDGKDYWLSSTPLEEVE